MHEPGTEQALMLCGSVWAIGTRPAILDGERGATSSLTALQGCLSSLSDLGRL